MNKNNLDLLFDETEEQIRLLQERRDILLKAKKVMQTEEGRAYVDGMLKLTNDEINNLLFQKMMEGKQETDF